MAERFIQPIPLAKLPCSIATGSMQMLHDGRLMHLYGDHYRNPKTMCVVYSDDDGQSWSQGRPLKLASGEDMVSEGLPTVIRLQSGALALSHTVSNELTSSGPLHTRRTFAFHTSSDEGQTWSAPVTVNPGGTREIVMMDSMIQLTDGRLVLPCSCRFGPTLKVKGKLMANRFGESFFNPWTHMLSFGACYYSDDRGRTWRRSLNETHATIDRGMGGGYAIDEPMIAELADDRLMLVGNSNLNRVFRAYSEDRGETWLEAEATDLVQRRSPVNLKRVPGRDEVLLIWNQISRWESMNGLFRHRISCALSKDGQTWQHHKNLQSLDDVTKIEPEPLGICLSGSVYQPIDRTRYHRAPGPLRLDHSCCTFHDGKAYISYGVNNLGDIDVIEKTYGLDPDEVALQSGFQRDPHTYGTNDPGNFSGLIKPRAKWWTGYNQFQAIPIDWFYHDND